MADQVRDFLKEGMLNILGGCCGSSPSHIAAIAKAVKDLPPRKMPDVPVKTRLAGLEPMTVAA